MAIGYYNFSPIQQGNQQVINSMAGLGQQISSAIETHAATESAKAMLPMLQQQYQAGMQRISAGDPNGMTDIYNASMTASQNPFLAPMAKSALTTAQSANINVQHMLRTQAAQQGAMERYGMRYGQEAQEKPMTTYQQEQVEKNASTAKNTQIDEYGALYSGDPTNKVDGIGALSSKISEAIEKGDAPDAKDIQNFANMYGVYKQKQSAYGKYAVTNPQIESAFSQVQKQVPALSNLVKKEQAKGTGKWWGNTDDNKVNLLNQDIKEIKSMGEDYLINKAKQAIKSGKDPKAVQQKLDELLKQMRNPSQATNPPAAQMNPSTSMLPAATGTGGMAQGTLDEEDDAMEDEDEVDAITGA
jgi:hypothetical protein